MKQAVAVEKFYATLHPGNIIPLPLTLGSSRNETGGGGRQVLRYSSSRKHHFASPHFRKMLPCCLHRS
jgi:hypothetical protein